MPFDPTEVRSRDELLMGAIATGDSTVIGDPRDRNEEFIKAIADGIGTAGKELYFHHLFAMINDTAHGVLIQARFVIINNDNTPITDTNIHSNASNIISISTAFIGSHILCYPSHVEASGSTTRLYYRLVDQDSDSKVVSSNQYNVDIGNVTFTDTIIAI